MQQPTPDNLLHPPFTRAAHLTQREQDILHLMAQDLSNSQIAERLVVAPGTVKWYVKEIYSKLGVHSRDEAIAQAEALAPPEERPPQPITPNNLPARVTTLVGREREIAAIRAHLLSSEVRLLTLIGTPGIGKTRLCIETAYSLLNDFSDGIYFIGLAPLNDPALVADAVMQALGLRDVHQVNVVEALKTYLRDKHALLILDNFEHLLEAAPLASDLLAVAPLLKVLTTSREPLRIYGEQEYAVPPLSLSGADSPEQSDAVALFVQRARAVKSEFALTPGNASAVAAICARLDGLPLAIELAAARVKLSTPQALLGRLNKRLNTLTAGARDLPQRQQTLRAAIDWSYQLLSEREKRLFAWLGVFAGGWTLEMLEAVCAPVLTQDVFDTFESLVSKSLIAAMDGVHDEPRFTMLETIREFALEQLEASGDLAEAQAVHAAYFLSMAETADRLLRTPESHALYNRLEFEMDNLRAALGYYHQREETIEQEWRMVVGLGGFWYIHNHLTEGLAHTQAAISRDHAQIPKAVRAGAYWALGYIYGGLYLEAEVVRAYETALPLAREAGDIRRQVLILRTLASLYTDYGKAAAAVELAEEAHALATQLGDGNIRLSVLLNYRLVLMAIGERQRAQELLDDIISLGLQLKDYFALAYALQNQAAWLNTIGDHEGALRAAQEGLESAQRWNNKRIYMGLLFQQHEAELCLGRVQEAIETAKRLMDVAQETKLSADIHTAHLATALSAQASGDMVGARQALRTAFEAGQFDDVEVRLFGLVWAGIIFTQMGEHATACRLYGIVEFQGAAIGRDRTWYFTAGIRPHVAATQAALGDVEYARLAAEGAALSIDEAWALVLAA